VNSLIYTYTYTSTYMDVHMYAYLFISIVLSIYIYKYMIYIYIHIHCHVQEPLEAGKKWRFLEHNGVIFPPKYEPHGVKMLYEDEEVDLTPEQVFFSFF